MSGFTEELLKLASKNVRIQQANLANKLRDELDIRLNTDSSGLRTESRDRANKLLNTDSRRHNVPNSMNRSDYIYNKVHQRGLGKHGPISSRPGGSARLAGKHTRDILARMNPSEQTVNQSIMKDLLDKNKRRLAWSESNPSTWGSPSGKKPYNPPKVRSYDRSLLAARAGEDPVKSVYKNTAKQQTVNPVLDKLQKQVETVRKANEANRAKAKVQRTPTPNLPAVVESKAEAKAAANSSKASKLKSLWAKLGRKGKIGVAAGALGLGAGAIALGSRSKSNKDEN